jgi:hypothetical protein
MRPTVGINPAYVYNPNLGIGSVPGGGVQYASFGSGADGAVTISADTTLTRDMYYTTLVVGAGKILTTAGWKIYASTSITNNGTISNNGLSPTVYTLGLPGAGGSLGAGGTGGMAAAAPGVSGSPPSPATIMGGLGGNASSGALGGVVNGASGLNKSNYTATSISGGGGGAGSTYSWQGKGAGGGGVVMISSPIVTNNGVVSALGGNGVTTYGGGGGGGGVVLIVSTTRTGNAATAAAGTADAGCIGLGGQVFELTVP